MRQANPADDPTRGAARVGHLSTLDPLRMGAVLYLRLWSDGPQGRDCVGRDFKDRLGPDASYALSALDGLCAICAKHGRRPLMRHDLQCNCLGADEAWFANLVEASAAGADEDAMMMAGFLVWPDRVRSVVGMAGVLGMALNHVVNQNTPQTTRPQNVTVH